MHLIEIKSHPGQIGGDASTWQWITRGGQEAHVRHPRNLANSKAKALKELLERSKAFSKRRAEVPYVSEVVFLSDPDLTVTLSPPGRHQVYRRDPEEGQQLPPQRREIRGIVEALTSLAPGPKGRPARRIDRPTGARIAEAIEQAGIRERVSRKRFGDYRIIELLADVDADTDTDTGNRLPGLPGRARWPARRAPAAATASAPTTWCYGGRRRRPPAGAPGSAPGHSFMMAFRLIARSQ